MSRRSDYEDPWGQDRYIPPEEERFAADMGQPSTEHSLRHEVLGLPVIADDRVPDGVVATVDATGRAFALCQEAVRCNRCDRVTVPGLDVLSLDAEGNLVHAECL